MWRFIQYVLFWNRCWETRSPCGLCRSWANGGWWSSKWDVCSPVSPRTINYRQRRRCQQLCKRSLHNWQRTYRCRFGQNSKTIWSMYRITRFFDFSLFWWWYWIWVYFSFDGTPLCWLWKKVTALYKEPTVKQIFLTELFFFDPASGSLPVVTFTKWGCQISKILWSVKKMPSNELNSITFGLRKNFTCPGTEPGVFENLKISVLFFLLSYLADFFLQNDYSGCARNARAQNAQVARNARVLSQNV